MKMGLGLNGIIGEFLCRIRGKDETIFFKYKFRLLSITLQQSYNNFLNLSFLNFNYYPK